MWNPVTLGIVAIATLAPPVFRSVAPWQARGGGITREVAARAAHAAAHPHEDNEAGASVPGSLVRMPAGTEVRVTLRSEVPEALWARGLEERPVDRLTAALRRNGTWFAPRRTTDSSGQDVARRSAVADTVLALAERWMAAWNEMDTERILAILGEDLQYYYLGERMDSRAVFERVLREEILPNETWSVTTFDPHVQVLGPDAAVVSFRYRGEMSLRGKTRPIENATSLVFERRGGEWKVVHIHDSSRPPLGR